MKYVTLLVALLVAGCSNETPDTRDARLRKSYDESKACVDGHMIPMWNLFNSVTCFPFEDTTKPPKGTNQ